MDKKTFEAIVFKSIFDVNNIARQEQGMKPLNLDPKDTRYGWKHYNQFRGVMDRHIKDLYKTLQQYLED